MEVLKNGINFKYAGKPVLVISHPRSGTHLTIDFIRKNLRNFSSWKIPGEPFHMLYLSIEGFLDQGPRKLTEKKAFKIISRPPRPVIKMHTYSYSTIREKFPHWIEWIENSGKIIYVTRDPRDTLISFHEYAKNFEPRTRVSFSDFIRQEFCGRPNRLNYWSEINREWTSKNNILVIKYEELLKEPFKIIKKIGDFTGEIPLNLEKPLPLIKKNIWYFRLSRFMIHPESTAILGTKKNKIKVSLRDVLNADDIRFIRANAGDEMARMGYEI